jgi:hypothetical protein
MNTDGYDVTTGELDLDRPAREVLTHLVDVLFSSGEADYIALPVRTANHGTVTMIISVEHEDDGELEDEKETKVYFHYRLG